MLIASQYVFSLGPLHPTQGELWYAVLALLLGLLIGVHMGKPGYMRRE